MSHGIERRAPSVALVCALVLPLACGGGAKNGGSGTEDTGGAGGSSKTGGKGGSSMGGKGGSSMGGKGGSAGSEGGSGGSEGGAGGGLGGIGGMIPTPTGFQFGAHPMKYPMGSTKPGGDQKELDDLVRAQYSMWKAKYLKADCEGYYVETNGGAGAGAEMFITVSEGHGYGMLIAALMAGTEPKAREIFDGMFALTRKFKSTIDMDLMAWGINKGCLPVMDGDSATDGDLDIAFALLLADKQWGSGGTVNYLNEAKRIITAIGTSEISQATKLPLLGDWSKGDSVFQFITRPSDWMPDHFRAFGKASGAQLWGETVAAIYKLVDYTQMNLSPTTGLIPDFIKDTNTAMPQKVPTSFTNDPKYLGEELKTDYDYNSCRVPWHLGTDYVASGDAAVKARLAKINTFIRMKTADDASKIVDGYSLTGVSPNGAAFHSCFTAGFGVASIVDAANQKWVDSVWQELADAGFDDYYGDTIRLLAMIVMSGNWWTPQ